MKKIHAKIRCLPVDKRGNAALSWIIVMVMALALIAMVFPPIKASVADTSVAVTGEMSNMMDTVDEQVIYHSNGD